jgi:polyisoprenoid-binding protein YceI
MLKKLIAAVVAIVLIGGVALWFFVLKDDPEPELSLETGTDTSQTTTGTTPESLDGTWTVQEGGDTTAGFRIEESFANGLTDHTAVGRSDEVTGSITIQGSEITEGDFTVDLTTLEFTDDPAGLSVTNRANAMKDRGLQTNDFPEATFTLTEPIDFGEKPAEGEPVTATATGDLTLHGVTKSITFDVDAEVVGDTIRVVTADTVPIVLADYEIEKPEIGPVASIDDEGSFEFLIVLGQG